MNFPAVCILVLMVALPVLGQEVYFLGGAARSSEGDDISTVWHFEYDESLGEHIYTSISYINEGHFKGHHRDGCAAQLWLRSNMLDRRLSLSAGLGPYLYFDTMAPADQSSSFVDAHGCGLIASLAATLYTEKHWLVRLRANSIIADEMDVFSVLLGVGCQLETSAWRGPFTQAPSQDKRTIDNELNLFGGLAIVNSFGAESSPAVSIEYRRGLWKYLEWSIAWLDEGENERIDRSGVVSQLWLARSFLEDILTLGFGGGVYYASDEYAMGDEEERIEEQGVLGVISMSGSYRFNEDWGVRVSWSRVLTDYDRDTDVLLGGVTFRF